MNPRVWALYGDKTGDNAQVRAIAGCLPWPVETRELVFKPRYRKGKPWFNASLRHVDRAASAPLEPPWPDLVITIGRRPAMAALWIRRQSGGRTRLVILGRPKRQLEAFDLVIASAQYRLPDAANVLKIGLPLLRPDPARLARAAQDWAAALDPLPRPLVVVLVGGATRPYRLDATLVPALLRQAAARAAPGGTIYVSTSRRTAPAVVDALRSALPPGARLHDFASGAPNPYPALLGSGDAFIVTGDSISMLTEVARLGRPLYVQPLPLHPFWRMVVWLRRRLQPFGLFALERDLDAFHQWLYEHNRAQPAGDAAHDPTRGRAPAHAVPTDDALDRVVARIRQLIEPAERAADRAPSSRTEESSR
ncbi:MAG: mitochondrial fission ELM1 family protein [Pseudomonadales bacterium]|nr:mitochondrial fission ELM1 family protein [Pseudomonadales bacterium]